MTEIWAHRGCSADAPENTLAAFRLAAASAADGVEFDVQLSRDGVPVVIHDERVGRTHSGPGWVKDLAVADLCGLPSRRGAGDDVGIPTLDQVLDLFVPTDLTINIELKNSVIDYPGLEAIVLDAVLARGLAERTVLSSFNHYSLRRFQDLGAPCELAAILGDLLYRPWDYLAGLGSARCTRPSWLWRIPSSSRPLTRAGWLFVRGSATTRTNCAGSSPPASTRCSPTCRRWPSRFGGARAYIALVIPLDSWTDLFTQLDIPLLEKVLRTVLVYLGIALLIRLAGKRLMAQMNSLDLVVVLLLSNVVQNAIIGPDNSLLGGLIGAVVLVFVNDLLDRLAQRVGWVRWLLEGRATPLIRDGVVNEDNVSRLGLTDKELLLGLRRLGADSPKEVKLASLEPGGDMMLRLKDGEQSATKDDLARAVAELRAPSRARGSPGPAMREDADRLLQPGRVGALEDRPGHQQAVRQRLQDVGSLRVQQVHLE